MAWGHDVGVVALGEPFDGGLRVPTGMKTGVSMVPCGVWSNPARTPARGHSATSSKEIWVR
jgi:hypothetical protein